MKSLILTCHTEEGVREDEQGGEVRRKPVSSRHGSNGRYGDISTRGNNLLSVDGRQPGLRVILLPS